MMPFNISRETAFSPNTFNVHAPTPRPAALAVETFQDGFGAPMPSLGAHAAPLSATLPALNTPTLSPLGSEFSLSDVSALNAPTPQFSFESIEPGPVLMGGRHVMLAPTQAPPRHDDYAASVDKFLTGPMSLDVESFMQMEHAIHEAPSPIIFDGFSLFHGLDLGSPKDSAFAPFFRAQTPIDEATQPMAVRQAVANIPPPIRRRKPAQTATTLSEARGAVTKQRATGKARGRAPVPAALGEKPFACDGGCGKDPCGASFKRQEHLKRHKKTIKDIVCAAQDCTKSFVRNDNMWQHYRAVHEKPTN